MSQSAVNSIDTPGDRSLLLILGKPKNMRMDAEVKPYSIRADQLPRLGAGGFLCSTASASPTIWCDSGAGHFYTPRRSDR